MILAAVSAVGPTETRTTAGRAVKRLFQESQMADDDGSGWNGSEAGCER